MGDSDGGCDNCEWANYWSECGTGQAVCGFKQSVEPYSSSWGYDNTALNAIRLYCCYSYVYNESIMIVSLDNIILYTAPKNFTNPIAYWDPVARIGGGGSLSYTTTYGVTDHQEERLSTSFSTSVRFGVTI